MAGGCNGHLHREFRSGQMKWKLEAELEGGASIFSAFYFFPLLGLSCINRRSMAIISVAMATYVAFARHLVLGLL